MYSLETVRTWVPLGIIVCGMLISCKPESTKPEQSEASKATVLEPTVSETAEPTVSEPAKPATSKPTPAKGLFAPSQLQVSREEITSFEYVNETGDVQTAQSVDEIPAANRAQVRVITGQKVTHTSPYVADFRTDPDPVKIARVPSYPPETADHAGINLPKIPNKRPANRRTTSSRKPIVVYSSDECSDCKKALAWAKKHKVKVTEKSFVEHKKEAIDACKRHGKLCNRAPIILVGGSVVTGFNERILDALTTN